MKSFRFSLENALRLRRSQLDIERAQVQMLNHRLTRLDQTRDDIAAVTRNARTWAVENGSVESAALVSMPHFQRRARHQLSLIERQRVDAEKRIEAQSAAAREAERRVKLLEKLRERRLAQWTAAVNAEQESFAAETFLSRWNPPN